MTSPPVIALARARHLQALQALAPTVRPGTPEDHPARAASGELAAELAALIEAGCSRAAIARAIGVTPGTVRAVLKRHGLDPQRKVCRKGLHPWVPANIYTDPGGGRHCKLCQVDADRRHRGGTAPAVVIRVGRSPRATPAERFAALVAELQEELRGAPLDLRAQWYRWPRGADPEAIQACPWARQRVTLAQAAKRMGLSEETLILHERAGRRQRHEGTATETTMPPMAGQGRWELGALALWRAAIWPGHGPGNSGRWPEHEEYLPKIKELLAEYGGRRLTKAETARRLGIGLRLAGELLAEAGAPDHSQRNLLAQVKDILAEYGATRLPVEHTLVRRALAARGYTVSYERVRRLVLKARPRKGPPPLGRTRTGTRTLAQAYRVRLADIRAAVEAGILTPAGAASDGRPLFDPAQITGRPDGLPGPVDKTYAAALEEEMRRRQPGSP